MKMDPVPDDPTIKDCVERLTQVHGCLESTDGKVEQIAGDVALIKRALGLEPPAVADLRPPTKPVQGLLSQAAAFRKSVQATVTSIVGLFVVYKFAVFMAPSAWAVLKAVNAFALH